MLKLNRLLKKFSRVRETYDKAFDLSEDPINNGDGMFP